MNMAHEDFDEVEFRAVSRSRAFASYDRKDFAKSPLLVEVLQASAREAEDLAIANGRAAAELRKQCENLRQELSVNNLDNEREQGTLRAEIRTLEAINSNLEEMLVEAHRQSAIAIVIAWLGLVLVGVGINLLTDETNQIVGLLLILIGACTEASAFFVRKRSSHRGSGATKGAQQIRGS
jgi:hypothetical protein